MVIEAAMPGMSCQFQYIMAKRVSFEVSAGEVSTRLTNARWKRSDREKEDREESMRKMEEKREKRRRREKK